MNYTQMTDFEINRRVLAIKSGIKPLSYSHDADKRSAGIVDVNKNYHWFDFCNSWADAGPIIERNSIGIEKEVSICCDLCNDLYETGNWEATHATRDFFFSHKNPLRAAMVVFLMMQEKNDE